MKIKYSKKFKTDIKLKISEDTTCIPSKTTYMEDGMYNGIYYFGDPKHPTSWRDVMKHKKKSKVTERIGSMIIKENAESFKKYFEVQSKEVKDSDGYLTEYTMYEEYVIPSTKDWYNFLKNYKNGTGLPEEWFSKYVFVFGDRDLYDPNDGYDEFDWECESENDAEEWFNDYNGFEDDDDEYLW